MAESFEVDSPNADTEEASYSNTTGFYGNLSFLMRHLTQCELIGDFYQQFIDLRSLFSWSEGFFPEKESEIGEKKLKVIQDKIMQAEKEKEYNQIKARQTLKTVTDDLYDAKKFIVRQMIKANLLITRREKGSDLWN